jgi:undecaprenyl-diphosphatase
MPNWIVVIILGIVEGVTEFLPVSSTGHLLIAEHWLGSHQSDLFNIVIQIGAVLAVIPLFWKRIEMLMRWNESPSRILNLKILVAFVITCIGGLILKKLGLKLPDSVQPIAIALIIGGIIFIVVETVAKGHQRSDFISWPVVIAVAVGQLIAAAFPGSSRSGSTIMLAMILGASRVSATEFSFLVGIPTMLAAGSLEVFDHLRKGETENWGLLILAAVTAAVVSFIAVKWLLRYVQSHTFVNFGIYRIAFGILLLWLFWPKT